MRLSNSSWFHSNPRKFLNNILRWTVPGNFLIDTMKYIYRSLAVIILAIGGIQLALPGEAGEQRKTTLLSRTSQDPLIGKPAGKLNGVTWLGMSPEWPYPVSDSKDSGKVTVIRWWTAPGCPYCRNSAPALNKWHKEFGGDKLMVAGLYHHKSSTPFTTGQVRKYASDLSFQFPAGIDNGWSNLNEWWLQSGRRSWTSTTFIIDKAGIIRAIHPGGEYIADSNDPDFIAIDNLIRTLINENVDEN